VDLSSAERGLFVADCFSVVETEGSFLPIKLPIPRLRSVRSDERLPFTSDLDDVLACREVEGLLELTAGCFACVGAEEPREPIVSPIRERWLVVDSFFTFETDGAARLLDSPIREAPPERAAGCSAPLGTDGLVVLIVLPIREVMLGSIRLFVLVAGLFMIVVCELLLDVFLVPMELPMFDVMLGLILLFVPPWGETEELSTGRLTVPRLLMLLRLNEFDVDGFDRVVICRPSVLEFGAVVRELIDGLDMLLLGALLVMVLLEMLLGARLVIALLDMLVLGALLVIALLEILLLGARLVMALPGLLFELRLAVTRLELGLDEMLLELLEEFDLGADLDEETEPEDCRLCWPEPPDLLLLERLLAAKTGS
jgi:hypothetical protein